ncbi:MAG: flavin reductase [Eubacteriales bacterium]
MNKSVLRDISYGVYAIGVKDEKKFTGCIVNTVFQITSEPMIIAISLNKNNYTYGVVDKTKRFAVSILSEKTESTVIGRLGFYSGKDTDKFGSVKYTVKSDLPVIDNNICSYLICEVNSMHDMGTHVVIFANIVDGDKVTDLTPMTYKYYHEVVKGSAPKNAPTYIEEKPKAAENKKAASGVRYICTVCGYIYEGDITKEPDTYRCPICNQPKSVFKKLED